MASNVAHVSISVKYDDPKAVAALMLVCQLAG